MASSGGELWISLFALEELFQGRATALGEAEKTLWGLLPDALVERVLLFLPKSDQARLRLVCKRWRQLMTSPAFLEETTALSFRHGYPICALPSTLSLVPCGCDHVRRLEERCKVRRVDFPGFMPPPDLLFKGKAFTKFGLPIIGLQYDNYHEIRCWLLNLANQSWRQLPPLRSCGLSRCDLEFWLVQKEGCTTFQVFAMRGTVRYTYFHTLSFSPGTSTNWQSFKIMKDPVCDFGVNTLTGCHWALISGGRNFVATDGGRRFKSGVECFSTSWPDRQLKHMMITTPRADDDRDYYDEPTYDNIGVMTPDPLPDFRTRECFKLLTDGDSDDVFAYNTEFMEDEDNEGSGVCLYKLDRAKGQWECLLLEQLPPGRHEDDRVQIVGSMVLIQFAMTTSEKTVKKKIVTKETLWIMAYNVLDGSCKWSRTLSGLGYDAATNRFRYPRRFTMFMTSFLAPL